MHVNHILPSNTKKLSIGATNETHAYTLHSGGGLCGLDNRSQSFVHVFVR